MPNKPIHPSAWHPQFGATSPRLLATAFDEFDNQGPLITGMWHAVFTAHTENGVAIPIAAGVVIDNAVVVWHSDGTEIMNSARSAQDGSFCLGAWKYTGDRTDPLTTFRGWGMCTILPCLRVRLGLPRGAHRLSRKLL